VSRSRQALLEFGVDGRGRRPALRLQERGELGQGVRVNGIRFGPLEQGLGEIMGLAGIDHAHRIARCGQGCGQTDPVRAGRFHHDQRLCGRNPAGLQLRVQIRIPLRRLRDLHRAATLSARREPHHHRGRRGDVDAHEQIIASLGRRVLHDALLVCCPPSMHADGGWFRGGPGLRS